MLNNNNIGFIGPGVMGKSMIQNLTKHGYQVSVYARNKEKAKELIAKGYKFYDTIKELVANNQIIITILGYPSDVEQVYFEEIFKCDVKGKILIDMTTSSPSLAINIASKALNNQAYSFDCPVTGGDIGAKEGRLTIFVGGDKDKYPSILPILESMGTTISYVGSPGDGQHAKLANQIGIAGALSAMAEMISYAKVNNLDVRSLIEVWASGSAGSWQLKNMGVRAINGDRNPGFFIKHFIKDLGLVLDEAKSKNLDLKMTSTVYTMFTELAALGYNDLGTQAIIDYYQVNK